MKAIESSSVDLLAQQQIFLYKSIKLPYFPSDFHFHEDCQLTLILEGSGKRIIGDKVDTFEKGEMILVGSKLQHAWHSNKCDQPAHLSTLDSSLTLFFNPNQLRHLANQSGNINAIETLLQRSQRGLKITGRTRDYLAQLLEIGTALTGLSALINFLEVINTLNESTDIELLCDSNFSNILHRKNDNRMNKIYQYVFENYAKDISIGAIAEKVGLTTESFCRFFKNSTKKTFSTFINEVRVSQACKLLNEEEEIPIGVVAQKCGYNSISNFNKFFKAVKNITPTAYRAQFKTR